MPKIRHSKNDLKEQRDALARYERFLPMLQLKKQQLQVEILTIDGKIRELEAERDKTDRALQPWIRLLSEPADMEDAVALAGVDMEEGNIAGVGIPVLRDVRVATSDPDLFVTPSWMDDAMDALTTLIRLRIGIETLHEQRRRIEDELRVTTQRVNLFEKVKIPECRENIRVIKIFLGDEQTAAVARAKLAKRRLDVEMMDI